MVGLPSARELTEEEIDQIIKDIEQSEGGDTIHVDMKKDTIVPKEVLESIQGKEVNIVLNICDGNRFLRAAIPVVAMASISITGAVVDILICFVRYRIEQR